METKALQTKGIKCSPRCMNEKKQLDLQDREGHSAPAMEVAPSLALASAYLTCWIFLEHPASTPIHLRSRESAAEQHACPISQVDYSTKR